MSGSSGPASASMPVNRPVISADRAANSVAEPALGAAEIGPGENDAGADDADADLAGARDREHEDRPRSGRPSRRACRLAMIAAV